ncbi:MAG: ZIP family metal transporter [Clostridia bacterium]
MSFNIFLIMCTLNIIVSLFGYFVGTLINSKNKVIVASMYQISGGMMSGIVCFELLPDSIKITNIYISILGIIIGIVFTLLLNYILDKKQINNKNISSIILVILVMTIHNIVEGISIGSGYVYMISLGMSLFISNLLHDIPESIILGINLNNKKIKKVNKVIYSILLGLPTSIGILLGNCIGTVSNLYLSLSLSISSGCMLYIIACDLIPTSSEISKRKIVNLFYIIGLIIGLFIISI